MYGMELMNEEKTNSPSSDEMYDVLKWEVIKHLLPYFRGDNTDGLIEAAKKITAYVEE